MNSTPGPVYRIRSGMLTVAVWRNQRGDATWYTATLTRSYREADGKWKDTPSLNAGDLMLGAELLRQAWLYTIGTQPSVEPEPGSAG